MGSLITYGMIIIKAKSFISVSNQGVVYFGTFIKRKFQVARETTLNSVVADGYQLLQICWKISLNFIYFSVARSNDKAESEELTLDLVYTWLAISRSSVEWMRYRIEELT